MRLTGVLFNCFVYKVFIFLQFDLSFCWLHVFSQFLCLFTLFFFSKRCCLLNVVHVCLWVNFKGCASYLNVLDNLWGKAYSNHYFLSFCNVPILLYYTTFRDQLHWLPGNWWFEWVLGAWLKEMASICLDERNLLCYNEVPLLAFWELCSNLW